MADLVIRGATIVDGLGSEPRRADLSRNVEDVLIALAVGGRLRRLVQKAPELAPPFDRARFMDFFQGTLKPWIVGQAAAIHDVILSFPEGYKTLVGEKGITLSGGQKQRVTIARTILKNPRVLILDDSTSSVDTETEETIRDALEELMHDRTTFIIAHRIQSVMNADPKKFPDAQPISELYYNEVIEMAYYGAQVIHPKTIKPLQNKGIPLLVKCFLEPSLPGTLIHNQSLQKQLPAIIVLKENQVLLQMSSKDFSFVGEYHVGHLYHLLEKLKIKWK